MKPKNIFFIIILSISTIVHAQMTDKEAIKQTINTFFEGFHHQDSVAIKNTVSDEVIMQTIAKNKQGNSIVKNINFNDFLKSIIAIPQHQKFEEKLLDYTINVDEIMANVWTPYEYWYNEKFSHCGVNSFQLFKKNGNWKIIYIIDTRRKEECKK